ncbi:MULTISPECIES: hypothetical protein [Stenotrophomonas]|nr:hypothetical protein [Stenotrophomonas maltophilia]
MDFGSFIALPSLQKQWGQPIGGIALLPLGRQADARPALQVAEME